MGFFKRLFGICSTQPPAAADCWKVADGKIMIDLDKAPELSEPGGAVRLEESGLGKTRILVLRGDDGRFHAFENVCSHVGHRRLDPVPGEGIVRCCSIGRSEFDYEGNRLAGSASEPVTPLKVDVEGKTVVVELR